MSGIFKCALRAAILFWLPHLAWAQEQLRAGVAKTVVTPDVHKNKVYLAGFGHNRIATGVHDNLYARCRSEEHTSELQSRLHLVCRLLLEKKKKLIQHLLHH